MVMKHFFTEVSSRNGELFTLILSSRSASHGLTMQSLLCFSSLQWALSLVTLVEIPIPQVFEQALHSVVWTKQFARISDGSGP